MSDSTRPIRALMRGLDALAMLNRQDGATVTEIAAAIDLPRTTTYRILETLCEAGYALRDPADDRYRPTARVRSLAAGFTDEAWIAQLAHAKVRALARTLGWPVALAMRSGTGMLVRSFEDAGSAYGRAPVAAGQDLPMLGSAAGRAYLAFCPPAERERLLAQFAASPLAEHALARRGDELERLLAGAREQGHATAMRSQERRDDMSLAVPVQAGGRVLATLAVYFPAGAVPAREATSRLAAPLRAAAAELAATVQDGAPG